MSEGLLTAEAATKHFPVKRGVLIRTLLGYVRAVDGISFSVTKGITFGMVGESGCGKTTVAKLLLNIERPTSGAMYFRDGDIHAMGRAELLTYRQSVQAVFQDPYDSLSPRMQVWEIVGEPLIGLGRHSRNDIKDRAGELLERVGLHPDMRRQYPHQFSGGQRQRIAIARALATNPELLVLDEPVSALDVSTRAQIMNLLKDLQEQFNLTMFMIAHDLPVVRYMSHQIAVMYLGQIVESGPAGEMYSEPLHPYTQALLAAVPTIRADRKRSQVQLKLSGEVPSPMNPPSGCRFHPRCPHAFDRCSQVAPELVEVAPGRTVACHLHDVGAGGAAGRPENASSEL